MKNFFLSKRFFVFTPLLLFVPTVPVAIANNNLLDPKNQNEYLLNGTLGIALVATITFLLTKIWSLSDIGFRPKEPAKGFYISGLFCFIGAMFAGPYARMLGFTETIDVSKVQSSETIRWSLLYVVVQDFLYWSFLLKIAKEIFPKRKIGEIIAITCVVLLFIWMHSIFHRPLAVMAFVAPGAIIFAWLYNKYKNLYCVFMVHAVYSLIAFYHIVFKY